MSDAARPSTASETRVRSAADALKAAIDRHLAAVEARSGEGDPAVLIAYEALASAADAYDAALYEVHDEVTPFEVPQSGPEEEPDLDEPEAVSVLIRRDYVVADPDLVRTAASRVEAADPEQLTLNGALSTLFGAYEPDRIAERATEFGLEEGDSTLWVTAAVPTEPGEWLGDPFEEAAPELLICRFDVTDAYEEELEALDS